MTAPAELRCRRSLAGIAWLLLFVATCAFAADPELASRIAALRAEIAHHDELYFEKAAPEITDYEYDLLKRELRRLEEQAGSVPASTAGIGDDRADPLTGIGHARPMLSLDKAYTDAEVATFWRDVRAAAAASEAPVRFAIEPKFDGVAVSVVLRRGRLVRAVTRGDGERGQDVTAVVQAVRGLDYAWAMDNRSPRIEEIELRGELYLSHAGFARLNAERTAAGEAAFRHPRSVAAGALQLDDPGEVAARGLCLVFHGWGGVKPAGAAPQSVVDFQRWLEACGLPGVAEAVFVRPKTVEELHAAVRRLHDRKLAYPTDGLVIKVDDAALQAVLGNGPTAPRWAVARKFAPPRAETVLRRIAWQVGRTGGLTPVAEFDPVKLGGATIRRASLHHAGEIRRRDLRIDDVIWIEKAGQIIPQVAGVEKARRPAASTPYTLPTRCPSCSTAVVYSENGDDATCPAFACPAQVVERLVHFTSRHAVPVRGLGPGTAEKLVAAGLVRSPADLYGLRATELEELPGIGEKTAAQLIASIAASREAPLERVLVGLGLPGLGPSNAEILARRVGGLAELLDDQKRPAALATLGASTAAGLESTLQDPNWRGTVAALAAVRAAR